MRVIVKTKFKVGQSVIFNDTNFGVKINAKIEFISAGGIIYINRHDTGTNQYVWAFELEEI